MCAIELEAAAQLRNDRRSHDLEPIIRQLVSSAHNVTQEERQQLTDLLKH